MCEVRDLTGAESKKSTGARFLKLIMSCREIAAGTETNKKELVRRT